MIDELIQKPHRRPVQDLNIVPILDMLTTVIFFLLLSASFLEYVKVTVPPSSVTTVEASSAPPAASPAMYLVPEGGGLRLLLTWAGEKAGSISRDITGATPAEIRTQLLSQSGELVRDFAKLNPKEKTLKVGLGGNLPFQNLISVMDGVRTTLPDVVLVSYNEAEARAASQPKQ